MNRQWMIWMLCTAGLAGICSDAVACPLDDLSRIGAGAEERLIRKASVDDIDRIVEIAQSLALERNQHRGREWLSNHGFLVSSYGRSEYETFMADDRTGTLVIEVKGEVLGFLLYYNKDFIDSADPAQELNSLARVACEEAYGEGANLYVIKQVGIDYSSGHRGLGSALYTHLRAAAKRDGVDFIFAAVVNDEPILEQAEVLGATFPLPNRASADFHTSNGYELVVPLFLYTYERNASPDELPSGLHNRELYGLALNPSIRPLPDIAVHDLNLP